MNAQLPAHLQNRQIRSLTERASEGMGGSMPPHVSLAGNSFTFVDAAGNEFAPMLTFDAAIIDVSDMLNKRYYDKPYNPKAEGEPPRCWSANGITPSREVAAPMAAQCDMCQLNVRGSAISQISQVAIKACRDERWIAIIVPQLPQVIFQMVITPGSFKAWKGYTETLRAQGVELSLVLTRFSFVPGSTGELLFEFVGWVDAPTADVIEAANREGKTDALVGRSDPVRQPALAAPVQHQTLPPPNQLAPAQEVIPPGQPAPFTPAQPAASAPMAAAPAFVMASPSAPVASPSEPAAPVRRRRGAAAPAAAPQTLAPAGAAPQAPFGQPPQAAPATAPFSQPAAPAAPANQNFGITPGAPVNADMLKMLQDMGFQRTA